MEHRMFICSLFVVAVLHTVHSQYKPPDITKPTVPSTDIHFKDENVTLKCNADAKPEAKYWWTFNGVRVLNTKVNDGTGELNIERFTSQNVGMYQCYAKNEIPPGNRAVAMSAVITLLKVEFYGKWPASTQVDIKSKAWDYVKLTCDNLPISIPKVKFSWELVKKENRKGDIKESDRVYIDNKGSLHFTYLKAEDANGNDLLYKCGLYNSKTSSIRLGSEKNLTVENVPESTSPATIQYHTDNTTTFLRTKNAELECVFSGYPLPTITWKNNKGDVMSTGTKDNKYEIVSYGRKLIVKDLKEEDEGVYKCIGDANEIKIFLDVTSGPIWDESLSSQTVVEGKDAVFKCKAHNAVGDRDTINEPIWYKNGDPIPKKNTAKFKFSDKFTVLTVKNTSKATDIMCFQCNVSNHKGYEFADGCLNLIEPIVIDVQPLLEQYVSMGDIVNLTVIGHTDPAYTIAYRWIFNGKRYDEGEILPFVIFNKTTMQAYINTSALSDSEYGSINGTYSRELFHIHDSRTVSIAVIFMVEVPVTPGPVVAAGPDLWWIALIVALMILIIVILIIGVICNRKNQEGTYPLDKKERANNIDPEKDLAGSGFHDLARASDDDDNPAYISDLNPSLDLDDDMNMGDDDSDDSDDSDTFMFNEDGSFIGQYSSKNKLL